MLEIGFLSKAKGRLIQTAATFAMRNPAWGHAAYDRVHSRAKVFHSRSPHTRKRDARSGWLQRDHSLPEANRDDHFCSAVECFKKTQCSFARQRVPEIMCAPKHFSLWSDREREFSKPAGGGGGKAPPRSCDMRPTTSSPQSRVVWDNFDVSFRPRECIRRTRPSSRLPDLPGEEAGGGKRRAQLRVPGRRCALSNCTVRYLLDCEHHAELLVSRHHCHSHHRGPSYRWQWSARRSWR